MLGVLAEGVEAGEAIGNHDPTCLLHVMLVRHCSDVDNGRAGADSKRCAPFANLLDRVISNAQYQIGGLYKRLPKPVRLWRKIGKGAQNGLSVKLLMDSAIRRNGIGAARKSNQRNVILMRFDDSVQAICEHRGQAWQPMPPRATGLMPDAFCMKSAAFSCFY